MFFNSFFYVLPEANNHKIHPGFLVLVMCSPSTTALVHAAPPRAQRHGRQRCWAPGRRSTEGAGAPSTMLGPGAREVRCLRCLRCFFFFPWGGVTMKKRMCLLDGIEWPMMEFHHQQNGEIEDDLTINNCDFYHRRWRFHGYSRI